jgi:nucleotide-binding universal stress UspA family protein
MFPPRVVLAAVDFSDSSRVALGCAARLARQCGAELHVLHAQDPLLAEAARAAGIELVAESRSELAAFAAATVPATSLPDLHAHVVTGPAVDVVRDIAIREGADLIVVAAHGMSGAERTVFGSTTEGVLRHADTSVLVVPDTWQPPRPEAADLSGTGPVVAALDLTMPAIAAVRAACRLAETLGTSVEAVHVVPDLPVLARWSAHAGEAIRQRTEAARAELGAALHHVAANVPIALHVDTGRIEDRLAERLASAGGPHPLLVLGRRLHKDRGGSPGSTAYRVLTLTRVPVLMYLEEQ